MTATTGHAPLREHWQPKPRCPVHTAIVVAPWSLPACIGIVEEPKLDVRGIIGKPNCGRDGWVTEFAPLADAL